MLATCNASKLPRSSSFGDDDAIDLLRNLYLFTQVHSQRNIDWRAAWGVSYQAMFSLAKLRYEIHQCSSLSDPEEHERVCSFLLAALILSWFTMSSFVVQGGLQRHLLTELMSLISEQMPSEICYQWARHASLEGLLWILFGVYTSIDGVGISLPDTKLNWLRTTMKMIVKRLGLNSYDEFSGCLRRLPFAQSWSNLACTAYSWLDGCPLVTNFEPNPSSVCAVIRLNFDPMQEVDRMKGHRSLKEIDSIDDHGEPRCESCREKVSLSSVQLFHFSSPK